MNRYYHRTSALIILFTLICCGGKKTKPDPDEIVLDKKQPVEEIMVQKSSPNRPPSISQIGIPATCPLISQQAISIGDFT